MRRPWRVGRALAPVALAALALLVGCGLLDMEAAQEGPCARSDDCPRLQVCVATTCRDVCGKTSDCSAGEICERVPWSVGLACQPMTSLVMDAADAVPGDATLREAAADGSDEGLPGELGELDAAAVEEDADPRGNESEAQDAGDGSTNVCPASWAADAAAATRIVLFGGNDATHGFLNDTWEWDGSAWLREAPTLSPPVRRGPGMASLCGHATLFGGTDRNSAGELNDQWEWDGMTWTQVSPFPIPPVRLAPAMTTLGGAVVLFGGHTDDPDNLTRSLNDTWTWNGANWTLLSPALPPSGRSCTAAATLGNTVVLFGGDDEFTQLADTFLWNGATWSEAQVALSPSARDNAAAATLGGVVMLFGGFDGANALGDTWTWNGASWLQLAPQQSPPARYNATLATLNDQVVLFGGQDLTQTFGDTWIWDGTNWTPLSVSGPPARSSAAMVAF